MPQKVKTKIIGGGSPERSHDSVYTPISDLKNDVITERMDFNGVLISMRDFSEEGQQDSFEAIIKSIKSIKINADADEKYEFEFFSGDAEVTLSKTADSCVVYKNGEPVLSIEKVTNEDKKEFNLNITLYNPSENSDLLDKLASHMKEKMNDNQFVFVEKCGNLADAKALIDKFGNKLRIPHGLFNEPEAKELRAYVLVEKKLPEVLFDPSDVAISPPVSKRKLS